MGYEQATATKVMATHCACCGRPLLDAKSVEAGMGPTCRERYGWDIEVDEVSRKLANHVVHQLAVAVSTGNVGVHELELAAELAPLGFPKIGEIFTRRGAGVVITVEEHEGEDKYFVRCPYDPEFNKKSWVKGRRGAKFPVAGVKKPVFHWIFPCTPEARKRLWGALSACFPGALAIGPKGPFQVSGKAASSAENAA